MNEQDARKVVDANINGLIWALQLSEHRITVSYERMDQGTFGEAYVVPWIGDLVDEMATIAAYWSSLFAHRRETMEWKGFVSVELEPSQDQAARSLLSKAVVTA